MNSTGIQTAPIPPGFKVAEVGMPPRPVDKYDAPSLLGNQARKRFHVMVKPGSSTCNLDYDYCFYLSKETLPDGPGTGRMSDEVLERFIQQYIAGVTGTEVVFSWQGGGSFLCTDQYCTRYMIGTRGKGDVDTGSNHLGFRCVKDAGAAQK